LKSIRKNCEDNAGQPALVKKSGWGGFGNSFNRMEFWDMLFVVQTGVRGI